MLVGTSVASVFETMDGGQTWEPRNKGLCASYLPDPHIEVGHDPHLLVACPAKLDVLRHFPQHGWRPELAGCIATRRFCMLWIRHQ